MPTSEILICFDTEDFSSDRSADAIRDTARLLTEEGIRANYNLVGLLAKQLIAWKRRDVLDALKEHEIEFHSWGHSMHPTICEYTDIADYDKALARFLAQESEGIGMVKAATGRDRLYAAVPPGANVCYVALYGYGKLGIHAYLDDLILNTPDGANRWFCNQFYIQYVTSLESRFFRDDYSEDEFVDLLASRRRSIFYNHPNRVIHSVFWDIINYKGENTHPWGEWEEAPEYPDNQIARFYERFRSLVRRLKAEKNPDGSPRFVFRTVSEVLAEETVNRTVTRADMQRYFAALKETFASGRPDPLALCKTDSPRISYSECLYAAARLIAGEESVCLDDFFSYGFLENPQGVAVPTQVTFNELTRALKSLNFTTFLPPFVRTGLVRLGPADLLLAALELICEEKPAFTVGPKPQMPSLDDFPDLRDLNLHKRWTPFSDDLKDEYLSDRLRLQSWTLRS